MISVIDIARCHSPRRFRNPLVIGIIGVSSDRNSPLHDTNQSIAIIPVEGTSDVSRLVPSCLEIAFIIVGVVIFGIGRELIIPACDVSSIGPISIGIIGVGFIRSIGGTVIRPFQLIIIGVVIVDERPIRIGNLPNSTTLVIGEGKAGKCGSCRIGVLNLRETVERVVIEIGTRRNGLGSSESLQSFHLPHRVVGHGDALIRNAYTRLSNLGGSV